MNKEEIKNLAGHPDAVPDIYREWFFKGYLKCHVENQSRQQGIRWVRASERWPNIKRWVIFRQRNNSRASKSIWVDNDMLVISEHSWENEICKILQLPSKEIEWLDEQAESLPAIRQDGLKSKKIIVDRFKKSTFIYHDDIPIDREIAEFIYELNKSPNIITNNSCAGHDKFESNASYDFISHPYLSFVVNETGWDIFWFKVLPEISINNLVHVTIADEFEKTSIIIRCHYDDKIKFWEAVKPTFLKYFPAALNPFTNPTANDK